MSGDDVAPVFAIESGGVTLDITVTIRDGYNDTFEIVGTDGALSAGAGGIFCDPQVNTSYLTFLNLNGFILV